MLRRGILIGRRGSGTGTGKSKPKSSRCVGYGKIVGAELGLLPFRSIHV